MVSQAKIQRRRNSKGGRWTPELLKKLYESRNTYSHLSWKEFHRKNLFPGRSDWALQKAFSSYKQDLRVERRTKRMHAIASTPKPSLYPPGTPVLKRPLQAEKDPRLRNRKQAKLDTSPKYNSSAPLGSKAGAQGPSPDPSSDTDSDDGDIPPSGRTEKFPKSAQQTKDKGYHASPTTISTATNPSAASDTSGRSESHSEQQSRSGPQLPHRINTLHHATKEPGASASDSPVSAQSKGSTPQAQLPSREETMPAQSLDMDLEKWLETAQSLARRTTTWEAERQGLKAINSTLQTMYSSLQNKHSTLQKDYDESQDSQNRLISDQDIRIEQLETKNKQLRNEVARLRDESCRECLKMRAILITKEEELVKEKEELAKSREELTQTSEWKTEVESKLRSLLPSA